MNHQKILAALLAIALISALPASTQATEEQTLSGDGMIYCEVIALTEWFNCDAQRRLPVSPVIDVVGAPAVTLTVTWDSVAIGSTDLTVFLEEAEQTCDKQQVYCGLIGITGSSPLRVTLEGLGSHARITAFIHGPNTCLHADGCHAPYFALVQDQAFHYEWTIN